MHEYDLGGLSGSVRRPIWLDQTCLLRYRRSLQLKDDHPRSHWSKIRILQSDYARTQAKKLHDPRWNSSLRQRKKVPQRIETMPDIWPSACVQSFAFTGLA